MKLSEPDETIQDEKDEDEERLKSFFRSNDERFKNLINEHRQFQLNQKKALFNRALRQTLTNNLVHPGLQACKTYEPSSPVEQDQVEKSLASTLKVPENQINAVRKSPTNRNLPTPRYYVPKRLPKRPTNSSKSPDRNAPTVLNPHGSQPAALRARAFDNSFGIRALERRIEEEMKIQSERRRIPDGLQRSVSLDVPDSTQKDFLQVSNLSTSLSFTNGSKPHLSYVPVAQKVNGYSSAAVVGFSNRRGNGKNNLGPRISRPPLKRQSNVVLEKRADEQDCTEQNTEESFLSGSNSDSFCQPEIFQDSKTKVTSCRQPLVSFNDIVDYLSISTDDNGSFEESRFEELHALLCHYQNGFDGNGQSAPSENGGEKSKPSKKGDEDLKPHANGHGEMRDAEEIKGIEGKECDPNVLSNYNKNNTDQVA